MVLADGVHERKIPVLILDDTSSQCDGRSVSFAVDTYFFKRAMRFNFTFP